MTGNDAADARPSTASRLLTIVEAADALRISRSSVYRLFDAGQLAWVQYPPRVESSMSIAAASCTWVTPAACRMDERSNTIQDYSSDAIYLQRYVLS